ncbi:amino acid ABC transporter substrate-binding protein [uncultured Shimia sp.]|uniref:amino acid ABC transporter substrate-binding protein n=1 Tax=uncultured Shimia sp. TaxID=573152 RepID=UPI0026063F5A|nr:amino acid ABC transporter substrate-binding protein [uncultured Shimia sp.]
MRNLLLALSCLAMVGTTASAQTLERIKEKGVMTLGYRVDAAPLSYQKPSGAPAGYSPTVCAMVAQGVVNQLELEGLEARFVPVDASDRFEKVASGEIDLLCGAASITLSRRALVDFSIPTFVDGTAILVQQDAPSDFASYAGKKLGARSNTTTKEALNNTLNAMDMQADVISFASHNDGVKALESGEIDGYFADQSILANLRMTSPSANSLKMSDEILTIEKHGLAMARGDADFRLAVDTALSKMYASGDMQRIFIEVFAGVQPGLGLKAMYVIAPTID